MTLLLDVVAYTFVFLGFTVPDFQEVELNIMFLGTTAFAVHIVMGLEVLRQLKLMVDECGGVPVISGIENGSESVVELTSVEPS
ncbi:hypothetical protein HK096_009946, partial [Nowakowskiella sp. JEL0078]